VNGFTDDQRRLFQFTPFKLLIRFDTATYTGENKSKFLYLVAPLNVHHLVPEQTFNGKRIFLRISFLHVLIDDKTKTINPVFASIKLNARVDVRNFLWSYNADERVDSGFEGIGLTPHD